MYSVLRRYRVRLGTVGEAVVHAERSLLPLLKRVPGFVAHYTLDAGENIMASLTLFETSDGAKAATRLLGDWFRSDWPAFQQIPPDLPLAAVLAGEAASGGRGTVPSQERSFGARREPGVTERRSGVDRRASARRRTQERRRNIVPVPTERRGGTARRIGLDRRLRVERRATWRRAQAAPVARHGIAPPWRRREPFRSR